MAQQQASPRPPPLPPPQGGAAGLPLVLLLARRLHALLLGVCCAALAFGWLESLYFFFSMPGPSPLNMRSDLIPGGMVDYLLMPFIFLLGMPAVIFAPCCGCCGGSGGGAAAAAVAAAAATPTQALEGSAAKAGGCSRCCSRCCTATFGRLPRWLRRRSDGWLCAALPVLLLLAAMPWPAKAPKAVAAHLGAVVMAVWLRRTHTGGDSGGGSGSGDGGGAALICAAPLVSQGVLLLACIRAAAWTPNVLFWSLPHALALALPALLLQAAMHLWAPRTRVAEPPAQMQLQSGAMQAQAQLEMETTALHPQVPSAPVSPEEALVAPTIVVSSKPGSDGAAAGAGGDEAVPAPAPAPARVPPSRAAVAAAALSVATLAHYIAYIGQSPSLLLRGTDPDNTWTPELSKNLVVLVPWAAAECAMMVLSSSCSTAQSSSMLPWRGGGAGSRAAAALFVLVQCGALAGFLLGGVERGRDALWGAVPSRCCAVVLVVALPVWLRIGASRLARWAAAGPVSWARLCLALAWCALANVLLCGLLWQSFVLVRGMTFIVLLGVLVGCDTAERWLLPPPPPQALVPADTVALDQRHQQRPWQQRWQHLWVDVGLFVLMFVGALAVLVANASTAPSFSPPRRSLCSHTTNNTSSGSFTVWSWNVQRGFSLTGTLNLEGVGELLQRGGGVDLLALQESEAHGPLTGGRDVAGYLGATTREHEVPSPEPKYPDRNSGLTEIYIRC
jgi:hypothetical protein